MYERRGELKAGKLVRIRVVHDGETVDRVEITGDFMLHPEEALERLEASFVGLPLEVDEHTLMDPIDDIVQSTGMQIIGFSTQQLARLVREVLE